jgi:hypothetical protein
LPEETPKKRKPLPEGLVGKASFLPKDPFEREIVQMKEIDEIGKHEPS